MARLILYINGHEFWSFDISITAYKNHEFETAWKLRQAVVKNKVERIKILFEKEIRRARYYKIILEAKSKMEIKKTEHYIEVNGVDNNGEFKIRIQKDCSQLQMETEDNDAYIDVNYRELKTIRDAITEVLDGFGKADA